MLGREPHPRSFRSKWSIWRFHQYFSWHSPSALLSGVGRPPCYWRLHQVHRYFPVLSLHWCFRWYQHHPVCTGRPLNWERWRQRWVGYDPSFARINCNWYWVSHSLRLHHHCHRYRPIEGSYLIYLVYCFDLEHLLILVMRLLPVASFLSLS